MNLTLELTDARVCELVRSASAESGRSVLLSELSGLSVLREQVTPFLKDSGCSTEALRAVLVYAAFPVDGSERAVTDISAEIGFSPSTIHRHISSWVAVGLLVQHPHSRCYRHTALTGGREAADMCIDRLRSERARFALAPTCGQTSTQASQLLDASGLACTSAGVFPPSIRLALALDRDTRSACLQR